MVKNELKNHRMMENFKMRGVDGSRLESLSDGIFALAIAILLITSNVPANYKELLTFVFDVPALGICIVFVVWIWRNHVLFFQRYGLTDQINGIFNMILLFFVLCYVYPLKFLISWLTSYFGYFLGGMIINREYFQQIGELSKLIPFTELPWLMVIYGTGFFSIFLILKLLYRHALRLKADLQLSELEVFETRFTIRQYNGIMLTAGLSVGIGLLGIATAKPGLAFLSGLVYNLIWILVIFDVRWRKKKLTKIHLTV